MFDAQKRDLNFSQLEPSLNDDAILSHVRYARKKNAGSFALFKEPYDDLKDGKRSIVI